MKHKLIITGVLACSLSGIVFSQEVKNLQECLQQGIENNISLRISRKQQQISDNNYSLGNAGFLPTLSLGASHSGSLLSTEQNYTSGEQQKYNSILNTTSNAGLNVSWNIFEGFNAQASYKKLQQLKQSGELNTRLAIENLVADITSEYYNLVQQGGMLNNLKYAVELSQERVRIDKERFLLGSGSKMQLLQSQVYLNSDSSLLVKQYEMVRASHIRLNEYLGLDSIENYFLIADTTIQLLPVPDYPALLETTLAANTSLELGRRKIEIAGFDKAIVMSRSYPYLTVSGGYGYNYYTYQSGTLQNSQNLGLNYGITLGFNIFDGFNRKREISNSIIMEEINRYEYQDIEQMVKSDLVTIYRAYENNLRLLDIEKQNLEIARENLEIALDRYKLGALSGLELREVQKSLLDAEERLLSIQYQTKLAEISLMKISGKVMEYL